MSQPQAMYRSNGLPPQRTDALLLLDVCEPVEFAGAHIDILRTNPRPREIPPSVVAIGVHPRLT